MTPEQQLKLAEALGIDAYLTEDGQVWKAGTSWEDRVFDHTTPEVFEKMVMHIIQHYTGIALESALLSNNPHTALAELVLENE